MELVTLKIFVLCTVLIYAHALLSRSIDISEALQVPGVINVVTAEDVPGKNGNDEEEAFAKDKVFLALGGVPGHSASVM